MSAEEADKTATTDASGGDEEEEWLYGGKKKKKKDTKIPSTKLGFYVQSLETDMKWFMTVNQVNEPLAVQRLDAKLTVV